MEAKEAIARSRVLVRRGELKTALDLLVSTKQPAAIDEAVRILASNHRFTEAADILVAFVDTPQTEYENLTPEKSKSAAFAAALYAKGDNFKKAVDILLALGQKERAVDLLEGAGKKREAAELKGSARGEGKDAFASDRPATNFGSAEVTYDIAKRLENSKKYNLALEAYLQLKRRRDAARMAEKLGSLEQAAELYSQTGMVFEAAICFMKVKNKQKCLENLVRVNRTHPKYRVACQNVVLLADNINFIDFQTEHVLTEFVQSGPENGKEVQVFYTLANLYKRHNMPENGLEILHKIEAKQPGYKDVEDLMKEMEEMQRASIKDFERVVAEDLNFEDASRKGSKLADDDSDLPGLPGLPDLPDLPPPPPVAAPAPISTAGQGSHGAANANTMANMATEASDHKDLFVPGAMIADRYRIDKQVGQGGMAMVFKAADLELDETVALKVFIRPIDDEETLERFKQELRLSRKLSHPNVIRLHDIGIFLGHRYLSMEFLVGKDLQAYMGEPMNLAFGLDILLQVCQGLQVAHDAGVIHRDMKPPNVFITDQEIAKVMDFGIAKNQDASGLTQAGLIFGTPQYMSPEQINDPRKVGPGTDIYAMGVMAYQMFTGTLPFHHPELVSLLMMQANQPAEPPRRRNDAIPDGLQEIIMKLLHKRPEDRFQSCKELSLEIEGLQRKLDIPRRR